MTEKNLIHLQISNFNLPVIYIINIPPYDTQYTIKQNIQNTHNFLKNTPVVINVANLTYKNNWRKLYQLILDTKLYVIGACSCNDEKLKKIIIKSGLPILTENSLIHNNHPANIQNKITNNNTKNKNQKTKLINIPIRSGQRIYARNRDLIIINDVSSGAEIIADGNIHIYGTMRGRILAGASGNETCQIFCTKFFSELVSINGHYWIGEQIPKKFIGKAVRIHLNNNILTINSL